MNDDEEMLDALQRALAPASGCIALERLAEIGESSDPTPDEDAHLSVCPICRGELELARSFFEEAPSSTEAARISAAVLHRFDPTRQAANVATLDDYRRRRRPILTARWAAAAMVALACGVVVWQTQSGPRLPPAPPTDTTRGTEIAVLPPSPSDPTSWHVLRWYGVPDATRYQVEVQRVDGEEIWSMETEATSLALPDSVGESIAPGVVIRWQVEALGADRMVLGSSPWTELRRPPPGAIVP